MSAHVAFQWLCDDCGESDGPYFDEGEAAMGAYGHDVSKHELPT